MRLSATKTTRAVAGSVAVALAVVVALAAGGPFRHVEAIPGGATGPMEVSVVNFPVGPPGPIRGPYIEQAQPRRVTCSRVIRSMLVTPASLMMWASSPSRISNTCSTPA